jgi:hypothetical protein
MEVTASQEFQGGCRQGSLLNANEREIAWSGAEIERGWQGNGKAASDDGADDSQARE